MTPVRPSLTIAVPAYNERATLPTILARVLQSRALEFASTVQVVVVDDGSTDGTAEFVRDLAGTWRSLVALPAGDVARVEVLGLCHPENRGKGAALRTAFAAATGELLLVQDADLEYDPADYPGLLKPLLDGRADVVYGSRFLPSERRVLFFWHALGNNLITLAANAVTDLNLSDAETGYKAFRTAVLRRIDIESDRFGVEIELTAKLSRVGARFYEVPIQYHGRSYAEGKKITWKDGVDALGCIARFGLWRNVRTRAGRPDFRV